MLRRRVPVAPPDLLRRGGGPPTVVAVPGNGLSVDGWRAPTRLLGSGTAVVALPSHGLPARRDDPLDPGANADRLLTRLDELDVARAVLLGHSASCQVVAEAARRAPHRVSGLVLVGPTVDPRAATWPRLAARWLATADWLDRLAALRPGIAAVTLPVGAHMVPITHPHELVAAVGEFVVRHR